MYKLIAMLSIIALLTIGGCYAHHLGTTVVANAVKTMHSVR